MSEEEYKKMYLDMTNPARYSSFRLISFDVFKTLIDLEKSKSYQEGLTAGMNYTISNTNKQETGGEFL